MRSNHHPNSVRHNGAGRFFLCLLLGLAACSPQQPSRLSGEAQGTYYNIQYYDPQHRNLQPQIDSILDAFDLSASLWVDSSLLRQLNSNQTDSIDVILTELVRRSLYINEYTDGAFDCRIGKLVQTWGFSFSERSEPDSITLATLLRFAHGSIGINGNRLVKEYPETELDFNAIAQGYSVDLLSAWMETLGINDYLIDVGGEVIAHGKKSNGKAWTVGIERPAENRYSAPEVQTAIDLKDLSVVTSGSYRKYYEKDGVKYSHTIDPATGRPVTHSLLSVSVVEKECWLADAMATAYMVMGLDSARQFIASHPDGPGTNAVCFIYDSCGTTQTYATPAFLQLEKQ